MESRLQRETNEVVVDRTAFINDVLPTTNGYDGEARVSNAYYMAPSETCVIINPSSSTNAYTVYLPPVAEARGKIYTLAIPVRASEVITVEDRADDSADFENASLDVSNDRVAYYSSGTHWFQLNVTAN